MMAIHRRFLLIILLIAAQVLTATAATGVNEVAEGYVRLVLEVGLYDDAYVDAYFGPDAWQPTDDQVEDSFPAKRLRDRADTLIEQLAQIDRDRFAGIEKRRYDYLDKQLRSVRGKIDLLAGVTMSFDEKSRILYDAVAPAWDETRYQSILDELDRLLPGEGKLYWRFNQYRIKFTVPRLDIDDALQATIDTYRQRARERLPLPADEGFETEFVFGKSWSAALTYQGNGTSLLQINSSVPLYVAQLVHLARHELYPGHHTHLTLLDRHLAQGHDWVEFTVLPLYSPLAMVAEGIAEYGNYDLFSTKERLEIERTTLLPLLDVDPKEIETYDKVVELKSELDGAVVEAARRYLDGQMSNTEARQWLRRYSLAAPGSETGLIRFIEEHRSYIITYTVGRQLVKDYINRHGGATDSARRWALFKTLLTTPQTPSALARQ